MERRVSVLYKGSIALYNVCSQKNGNFIARLYSYKGAQAAVPPKEFLLHKEGRHWEDDSADENLVNDVGNAIEYNKDTIDEPVCRERGYGGNNREGRA